MMFFARETPYHLLVGEVPVPRLVYPGKVDRLHFKCIRVNPAPHTPSTIAHIAHSVPRGFFLLRQLWLQLRLQL